MGFLGCIFVENSEREWSDKKDDCLRKDSKSFRDMIVFDAVGDRQRIFCSLLCLRHHSYNHSIPFVPKYNRHHVYNPTHEVEEWGDRAHQLKMLLIRKCLVVVSLMKD